MLSQENSNGRVALVQRVLIILTELSHSELGERVVSNYRGLEMIRCFLAVFVVSLGFCSPLAAQSPTDSANGSVSQIAPLWKRGIERIQSLYLERGDLTATAIFDGVVEQLEGDIPWLMVQADGDLYRFSYGAEREIGTMTPLIE